MNKSFKLLLVALSIGYAASSLTVGSVAMIRGKYVKASEKLGDVMVIRNDTGFYVVTKYGKHLVESHDIDTFLNKMNEKQLEKFLKQGCTIKVVELENGQFKLMKHVPGLGGGPISAAIAYWVVKGGAATVAVGAVSAAAAATGGAVLGPLAAGAATVATAGASVGVAAGGAALATTAAAPVLATGAAAAGTAGFAAIAGAAAAVETASLGAAAFFLALPIP